MQTASLELRGLPGSVADYHAASRAGRAKRYMARVGATKPLGLQPADAVITSIEAYTGRRRRLRSSKVAVMTTITALQDMSADLQSGGFLDEFTADFQAAAENLPASLALTGSELNALKQETAISSEELSNSVPEYETSVELVVPSASDNAAPPTLDSGTSRICHDLPVLSCCKCGVVTVPTAEGIVPTAH